MKYFHGLKIIPVSFELTAIFHKYRVEFFTKFCQSAHIKRSYDEKALPYASYKLTS